MASLSSLRVLGQLQPASAHLEDLYTVTTGCGCVISSIVCANIDPAHTDTIRIRIAPNGASDDPVHSLYHDVDIPIKDVLTITSGITLNEGDVVRVFSLNGTIVFQCFGEESLIVLNDE
jgi:hypothetical protein